MIIASRQMFTKHEGHVAPTTISISMPDCAEDGLFSCHVQFSGVPKYDAKIRGSDSINALECALTYIDGICTESKEPEFQWEEAGDWHKGRPL